MAGARPQLDQDRARSLDRLIARLARDGISLALAQAELERAEIMLAREAFPEALDQLHDVLVHVEGLTGREARMVQGQAHLARARYEQEYGAGLGSAHQHASLGLDALEDQDLTGALGVLAVELLVYRGRLLLLAGQDGAHEDMQQAVEVARGLEHADAHLVLLGARRELSVALAQLDVEAGLAELDAAVEDAAAVGELPSVDEEMARSTRAELLANADRFDEALSLLEVREDSPDWVLAQRAATCDMADLPEAASEAGRALIERRSALHELRDPASTVELVKVLVSQATRAPDPEERLALATRTRRLIMDCPSQLPVLAWRLLARALELAAGCLGEPDEVHEVLATRASLLEDLVRDMNARVDQVELVRAWLQLGDSLMDQDRSGEARRVYGWAVRELSEWPEDDPVVKGLLPLAGNALGHAQAHEGYWGAALASLERATALLEGRQGLDLLPFAEVFLFRALCCVSVGDPRAAMVGLRDAVGRLVGGLGRNHGHAAELAEAAVELCMLQAEVLIDHLEDVDAAVMAYDQAEQLRELVGSPPESVAMILGAKGAALNESGRSEEAHPVLQRCVELLNGTNDGSPEDLADVALARVNLAASLSGLGKPRDALTEIGHASSLLESVDDDVEPPERARHQAIRTHLFLQRGEALVGVGHPLLAADEFTRSIDLCEQLLDEDGEAHYEARMRLPLALLRRARCWVASGGDHTDNATPDLRKAYKLYAGLIKDESRPEHRRRLREVRDLQRHLKTDV